MTNSQPVKQVITLRSNHFFARLQKNPLNRRRWEGREDLRLEIVYWIEGTHHRRRRKAALGKLTPIGLERIQERITTAAQKRIRPVNQTRGSPGFPLAYKEAGRQP
jgi:cytochrome P450